MENIVRDGGDATADVTSNEMPEDPATDERIAAASGARFQPPWARILKRGRLFPVTPGSSQRGRWRIGIVSFRCIEAP
jgi:hypothetical protein